jgi:hypothetical protein
VGGRIWVTRSRGPLAIDPRTNGVTRLPVRIDPGRGRRSIAQFTVAGGGVWAHVADESVGSTHLERIDPVSLRVTARWRPPPRPRAFARDPVGGAGGLWVTVHRSAATGRESDVRRLDAVTGRELARLPVAASELAADDTTVVAVDVDGRAAVLIDPADGSVRPLATPPPEGRGFLDAAIGYGSAWLPSYGGILTRVDLVTRTVHRISIPAATPPGGREDGSAVTRVAVGAGSVWALTATGHVVRVDPARNRPVGVVGGLGSARGATRRYFDDILVTEDAVWVAAEDGGRPVVLRIDPDR